MEVRLEDLKNLQTREDYHNLLYKKYKIPPWPCNCYDIDVFREYASNKDTILRVERGSFTGRRRPVELLTKIPAGFLLLKLDHLIYSLNLSPTKYDPQNPPPVKFICKMLSHFDPQDKLELFFHKKKLEPRKIYTINRKYSFLL